MAQDALLLSVGERFCRLSLHPARRTESQGGGLVGWRELKVSVPRGCEDATGEQTEREAAGERDRG